MILATRAMADEAIRQAVHVRFRFERFHSSAEECGYYI